MKTRLIGLLMVCLATLSSCSGLKCGETFTQTYNAVEYNFEVIVSYMPYVRISPLTPPDSVKGEVVLPELVEYDGHTYKVTQIGQGAFQDYKYITSIKLPAILSVIEDEAFKDCIGLRTINTPQPLSKIGKYAFDGCLQLQEFSLDASISELGEGAFHKCTSLKELNFTPTFTAIPDELCKGCVMLQKVELPSTIMTIGASAFEGCVLVKSISFDSSVQRIGVDAFKGCWATEQIRCKTPTPPECSSDSFDGIDTDIPVIVPMAHVADYQNAIGWDRFTNITGEY